MLFLEFGWETTAIRFCPCRLETDASPVLWEIDVEEQTAELVFPIIEVHEECAVVLIGVELLIGRQGVDVIHNIFVVHLSFLALVRPGELPLGLSPRIPQPQ